MREQGGKRAGSWSQELALRTRVLREGLTIHGHHCWEVWCSVDCTVSIAFGSAQVSHEGLWKEPSLWSGEDRKLTAGVSGKKCWKGNYGQPNLTPSPPGPQACAQMLRGRPNWEALPFSGVSRMLLSQERGGKLEREKEKQSNWGTFSVLVRRDETLNSVTNILSSGLQTPLVTLLSLSLSVSLIQ